VQVVLYKTCTSVESSISMLTLECRERFSILTHETILVELSNAQDIDFYDVNLSRIGMRIRFGEHTIEHECSVDVLREMFPSCDIDDLIEYSMYSIGLKYGYITPQSDDFEENEYWNSED